jgi:serine phosphatase RsbU (regulator of sigma subunit)
VRYLHDPKKPTSLSHDHINDVYEDKAGHVWVATWGGGLDKLDRKTEQFTAYGTEQGLASEVVYGVLEDKNGILWLPTDHGLTRFDPEKQTFTNYTSSDGLQDDEFGQGTFHKGGSGLIYVGGPRGFNVFVPENIQPDNYVPPVVLTNFELLGQKKPIPSKAALSFRDRWFSVEFAALGFAAPERNRYKYRLTGFHDWIETNRRFVSYSSLPPGDYTLEVLGSNGDGRWSTTGVKLPIHVAPPPWRTWWAYTIYGLLTLLVAALFLLRQRSQLAALRRAHRLSELEREIALTSTIQEGFLPPERSLRDRELSLEGFYRPAAECGGDWWSYEQRGNSYMIVVGDATGHGAGSAMVTAAAAACFRSLGTLVDDDTRMHRMNEEVLRVSRGQYHMTLTAVDLDIETGRYDIQSAGGVPVFSLAPGKRARVLMCPGTPLGSPEFEIGRLQGQLVPGERLLVLTDGIPEVSMANAQLLGPRGVANFYMQTREEEVDVALQHLITKVEEVQAGAQDDDWTVVLVQWGTPEAAERAA